MNITIINGGSGASNIINSLIKEKKYKIISIINTFDDGKSTGRIRKFLDIPGPSDMRKVHSLFLNKSNLNYKIYKKFYNFRLNNLSRKNILLQIKNFFEGNDSKLFSFKFSDKLLNDFLKVSLSVFYENLTKSEKLKNIKFDFTDCSLINCCYAGSYFYNKRNISKTALDFEKFFKLNGKILCITNRNLYLSALMENQKILHDEESIIKNKYKKKIIKLFLTKNPYEKKILNEKIYKAKFDNNGHIKYKITNEVKNCILNTNILIFAPGTQFSSLYPTYMAKGLKSAINKNKKIKKVFFSNIINENDTYNFKISDYINNALDYLDIKTKKNRKLFFDYILVNKFKYKKNYNLIKIDLNNILQRNLIIDDFADNQMLHHKRKINNFIKKL